MFSGRGAFIHVGAFIGTIMAANVFMVIIPNQRKITAALLQGERPDPQFGAIGKQRSLHNTYLTLPVLLMMISNHYPMITDHAHAWMLAGLIVVGRGCAAAFPGAHSRWAIRIAHIAWTLPLIGAALAAALSSRNRRRPRPIAGEVTDEEALSIVQTRCAPAMPPSPPMPRSRRRPRAFTLETLEEPEALCRADRNPGGEEQGHAAWQQDRHAA